MLSAVVDIGPSALLKRETITLAYNEGKPAASSVQADE